MPALTLDAAFVHLNLGDDRGNAAYTGIDPYFDDLFLMAADRRFLSVERVVLYRGTDQIGSAAGTADQPDDGRHRRRGARRRPLHHQRTGLPPRREVPAALRRGRRVRRDVGRSSSRPTCPASEADYQAAVRRFTAEQSNSARRRTHERPDPRRGVRRRVRRTVPRRRRDHGQPDDHHRVRRRPPGPTDVLPRHPADRRRGPSDRRHARDRGARGDRGLDAVRPGLRDPVLGQAPRGDGRQPDRPLWQPEPVGVRARAAPDASDVRRSRRPGQRHQPRDQLLGGQPLQAGLRR